MRDFPGCPVVRTSTAWGMSLIPGLEIKILNPSQHGQQINKIYDPLKKVHMISLQAYRSLGR